MTFRTLWLSPVLLVSALAAQELHLAPRLHVNTINAKPGYFNEPAIAVNPKNPLQAVVAWQINASVAYTKDGGETWKIAEGTAPADYRVSGDVSVAFDDKGHAILCYIAFDKLGTTNYWAHGATRNGIFIRRSLDGGQTWEPNAATVIAHDSTPGIPFEDKPWVVADTAGPHAGNLYVGWTQFTLSTSELLFSRSTNGGKTWSKPIKLSSVPGLPRDDNGALEGFHGVTAADGSLYTIWADREGIMMAASHDGGISFTRERQILRTGPPYFGITGVARSNGFPQIGIDPRNGNLHVAWSDYTNGDVDVFASTSSDHGHTWGPPVRVNNDPLHNGNDQFFQWMSVDRLSGAIDVVFYDRRLDNKLTTVTLARSTDGGRTFSNYALDKDSFDAEGDFLGDYLAITDHGNRVFAAWAHQTSEEAKEERSKKTRTVVRVGVADFN